MSEFDFLLTSMAPESESESLDIHSRNLRLFQRYIPAKELLDYVHKNPSYEEQLTDEQVELLETGRQAYEELVSSNTGLVVSLTEKYRFNPEEHDDLIQIGLVFLIESVREFDPELGFKFSTFATSKIKPALAKARGEEFGLVRLPSGIRSGIRAIHRVYSEIQAYTGQPPTVEELSIATGFSEDKVRMLEQLKRNVRTISTEEKVGGAESESDITVGMTLEEPSHEYKRRRVRQLIAEGLDELSERDREIITESIGLLNAEIPSSRTLADRFGLSHQGILNIQERGLEVLRKKLGEEFDIVQSVKKGVAGAKASMRSGLRKDARPIDVGSYDFEKKFNELDDRYKKLVWLFFNRETGEQIRTPQQVLEILEEPISPASLRTYLHTIRKSLN